MNQHRRIEHREHSPVLRCALAAHGGVFFRGDGGHLATGEFAPLDEVANFYGSVDSFVAHMLLWRCAGCVGVVEGR